MEELKRIWGRNVEDGRKALGLTQVQLARTCDVTQQTISSIERGEYAPRDDLKITLATVLHQDVHRLFPLIRTTSGRR